MSPNYYHIILTQLTDYVPANVKNSEEVIEKLKNVNSSEISSNKCFISLDVINLYPSIKIDFGIEAVLELAQKHWQEIDNWYMTADDLKKCLTFICYNYEINVADETYLQTKGCPMGAHFAPPFAIIAMNKIETATLRSLKEKFNFIPEIYVRYIDDILIGPIEKDSNLPQRILDIFNEENESIKFTIEIPQNTLNFLDMSIEIQSNKIEYSWFEKPCHSQNSLKSDSFVPNHIKKNFVSNYVKRVENRCSNQEKKNAALTKLEEKLKINGHNRLTTKTDPTKKVKFDDKATILSLDFISDSCDRKVKKILKNMILA